MTRLHVQDRTIIANFRKQWSYGTENNVLGWVNGQATWTQITPAMLSFVPLTSVFANPPISATTLGATVTISHDLAPVIPGTYSNATVTVNGTGHVTSVSTGSVGVTSVGATFPIQSSGGATPTISHATSGVSAGTFTNATVTVNATGHVTSASSGSAPVTSVNASSPISSSGGTNPTISHGNSGVAAGTYNSVTVDARGHVTAGTTDYITATRGEATRTAITNITADNTWTNSQLSVTIADAGTYLVTAVVPVSIKVSALGSSPRIVARLFNATGGAAVTSSYAPCIEAQLASTTIVGCATLSNIVTVAANTTLRVEILRTAGPTYTASNLFYVAGFYVPRMNYVRLV